MKTGMPAFFILLLLFINTAHGYTVAVSPSQIQLDHRNHGWVTLINTNDQRVYYELNSTAELSRKTGVIESEDTVKVAITSAKDATLLVSFHPQFQADNLGFLPQLSIPVIAYRVSVSEGISVMLLVIVTGLALIGLTAFFAHRAFGFSSG